MKTNEQRVLGKIYPLQGVRAFAAIFVMLFHGTQILQERLNYVFLNNIFSAGNSGVDVFFVLSGFIIFYTSNSGTNNISKFIKKRFIRIYPIYWVVTLLLVISYYTFPTLDQLYKSNLKVILGSLILFPQKYYIVGVAWTLTFEVLFYLVFAATYFKNQKCLFYVLMCWVLLILTSHFLNFKTGIYSIDIITNPIIINFILGCILGKIYKDNSTPILPKMFFWGGVLSFCLMWYLRITIPDIFSGRLDVHGEFASIYMFGIPSTFLIYGILYYQGSIPKFLVYLGDASYSIYLIHGTVLSALIKVILKLRLDALFASFVGSVLLFLCTVGISCVFYSKIEKNILVLFSKK